MSISNHNGPSTSVDTSWESFINGVLPKPTENKYFNEKDFVTESFSVDQFVDHLKDQPLEELQELLSSYLKKLRVTGLDLVYADYTNFVQLSNALFDLQKTISKVHEPLIQAQKDVEVVRGKIQSSVTSLKDKINQLKAVRRQMSTIEKLGQLAADITRIESMVSQLENGSNHFDNVLERRLLVEETFDNLTASSTFISRCEIESSTTQSLTSKTFNLLQIVTNYRTSREFNDDFPFDFLLQ